MSSVVLGQLKSGVTHLPGGIIESLPFLEYRRDDRCHGSARRKPDDTRKWTVSIECVEDMFN